MKNSYVGNIFCLVFTLAPRQALQGISKGGSRKAPEEGL